MTRRPLPFDAIDGYLSRVRLRLVFRDLAHGLGWSLALGGAAVLLCALGLGLLEVSPLTARLAFGGAGLLALGLLGWRGVSPALQWRRARLVAEQVEAGMPALRDGLIASVGFGAAWPPEGVGSVALVEALAESVERRLKAQPISPLVSFACLKRSWAALGTTALLWASAVWLSPTVLYRGLAAPWPKTLGAATVSAGPLVGDLNLTLLFPPHMGRPQATLANSAGDLLVPKGTQVRLTATTLSLAKQVSLRFEPEGGAPIELALALREGRDASGEFVVEKAGAFRFVVVGEDQVARVEEQPRVVRLELDAPPTVTLKLPAADQELDDPRMIPLEYEVSDDYGLSKVQVVVGLAADPEHPERVPQEGASGRRFVGADDLDLSIVQAQHGDRIAIFVEAFDNDGVDGPKRSVSVTRYITVRSPQQKHYALTDDLKEVVEKLLIALADRLEADLSAPDGSPAELLDALAARSKEAATALAGVVSAMSGDPLTPEEVRLALAGRLGALETANARELAWLGPNREALASRDALAVTAAAKGSEAVVDALEQAIVLVEAMVARLALEDMAALTEELRASQEQLRELIAAYKQNPSEALKGRIMRDIQRLRARMDEIRERMSKLHQKLPEEFLNLDGMKKDEVAKGLEKTADQLGELEKMLNEGKIDEALAALDEMSKMLDELDSSLNKDMQTLQDETNPEVQRAISELMDQTRDLIKQQEDVAKETETAAQEEQKRIQDALQKGMQERLARIKENAAKLRLTMERLEPMDLPSFMEDEQNHLQQRIDDLNSALERNQLVEALERAERALDHLDSLSSFNGNTPAERRNQERIDEGKRLGSSVARELSELLDEARQAAGEGQDGQKMEGLSQRQRSLGEGVARLQSRIQSQAEKVPGLGEKVMEHTRKAGQSMQQSAEKLGEGQPNQARPGQQEALSELGQLMDGLKKAAAPKPADRGQQRGRQASREKVRIPGADEYQAPEAFRKALLEAMKDRPPEDYREQVKRYYEALVR